MTSRRGVISGKVHLVAALIPAVHPFSLERLPALRGIRSNQDGARRTRPCLCTSPLSAARRILLIVRHLAFDRRVEGMQLAGIMPRPGALFLNDATTGVISSAIAEDAPAGALHGITSIVGCASSERQRADDFVDVADCRSASGFCQTVIEIVI